MGRKKGNTRERILEEALKLFSINGFDAVSIRTIADHVGIGNSALYKHFKSKQEIFDSIVSESKERYLNQCSSITDQIRGFEDVKKNCLYMFEYQTTNEWIVAFRQMLLLEKFKNPEIAGIFKEFFVDIPINNQIQIFESLQEQGMMVLGNPRVFAMELYAPFFLYHYVEHNYDELKTLYEIHVDYFFKEHFITKVK